MQNFNYLSSCDLDHGFSCRMLDSDLAQDGVAVVGHDDAAHGVHQHLKHGLGAETCSDDITDGFTGLNVFSLDLATCGAFRVLAQDQDGTGCIAKHLQSSKTQNCIDH